MQQEQYKPETISTIIADIQNKLGPLVNLAHLIHTQVADSRLAPIIKQEAERGVEAAEIIRKQLEKIVELSETKDKQSWV